MAATRTTVDITLTILAQHTLITLTADVSGADEILFYSLVIAVQVQDLCQKQI